MKIGNPSASLPPAAESPKAENAPESTVKLAAPDTTRVLVDALLASAEGKALLERVLLKYLNAPLTPGFGLLGLANLNAAGLVGAPGLGLKPEEKKPAVTTAAGLTTQEKIGLGALTGATAGAGVGLVAVVEVLRSAAHADPHGFGHTLATVLGLTAIGGAGGTAIGGGLIGEVGMGPVKVTAPSTAKT